MEPIIVHTQQQPDGSRILTVETWPRETSFEDYFLTTADPSLVHVDGDMVTLTVANGEATYHLGAHDGLRLWREARLVSARLTDR